MVTKTWNGASADYSVASDWVPQGTPGPGDIADITAGTVTASGGTIAAGTTVNVSSGAAATALLLTDAFVARGTRLNETAGAANVVLGVTGTVTSQGAVNFTQSGSGNDILGLNDAPGGASSFVNNGGFSSTDAISVIQNLGNASNQLVNNGIISARTSGTTQKLLYVTAPIGGTGLIRVDANETLLPTASVGAGQTVLLEPGVGGASFLQLADAAVFGATIVGFGSADRIQLTSPSFDNATITAANGVSTLSFSRQGTSIAQLKLQGSYDASNLTYTVANTSTPGAVVTTINTTVPDLPANFGFTDTAIDISGKETGAVYTGPVEGLNWEYIWNNADNVAISAKAANVFLKGAGGDDALLTQSGRNVLDGSTGSNFLVGSSDPSSADTFFVDGRGGGVTWSTIVNFHLGDSATIFGFVNGTSTLPFTANDGVAGFTGMTIHSELSGAGTGVNGSMTFAGLDAATFSDHVTITTGTLAAGTPSALPYLLLQYDH